MLLQPTATSCIDRQSRSLNTTISSPKSRVHGLKALLSSMLSDNYNTIVSVKQFA